MNLNISLFIDLSEHFVTGLLMLSYQILTTHPVSCTFLPSAFDGVKPSMFQCAVWVKG